MKTNLKRWLAAALCLVMTVGLVPGASAMAEEAELKTLLPISSTEEIPADPVIGDDPIADLSAVSADGERPAAAVDASAGLLAATPAQPKKNLAKGKTAIASSVYPGVPYTADKAVDGINDSDSTKVSRWSSKRIGTGTPAEQYTTGDQWLKVDLGEAYALDQIDIYWEGACATAYDILVAAEDATFENGDDDNYTAVVTGASAADAGLKSHTFTKTAEVRFVKVLCKTPKTARYGYSIFELEVYSPDVLEEANTDVNLSYKRPVTCSTQQVDNSNNNAAANAVDGDPDTRWASSDTAFPQWIAVDLGRVCDLTRFVCNFYNASERAYKYKILVSDEAIEFGEGGALPESGYTVAVDNTDNASGGLKEHEAPENTSGRYVTLYFSGCSKVINSGVWEFEVYGANPNLALGKTVTYSGVEGDKVNGSWKYPQFVGENAVDGKTDTRWSGNKVDDAWLLVDLGEAYELSQIDVNFFCEAKAFTIKISENGTDYTTVLSVTDNTIINVPNLRQITFESQNVRYIKYQQSERFTHPTNGQKYSGNITELEAYQYVTLAPATAKTVLAAVEEAGFTLPETDGGKVTLPEVPEGYKVEFYGSDYKAIVALDGTYHQPLVDKDIHVMYKVTNLEDPEDVAVSANDVTVHIPGQHSGSGVNPMPQVIPTLQEWYGEAEGVYTLTETSKIVYADAALQQKAELLATYLKNLLGVTVTCREGTDPATGDIYLTLSEDAAVKALGKEGYALSVGDHVQISSGVEGGVFYGGVTVVQALYLSDLNEGVLTIAKGTARDYPKYEVRSIAVDIARSEIKLDYIKEITEMLPFFKVNEIVLHINDDRGDKITNSQIGSEENRKQAMDLSSFRIENEKGIGAHAYQISKADYIQYQLDAAKYGVTVVTELDTPAHSAVFSLQADMVENMYDVRHLKITESTNVNSVELYQPTMDFVDALVDELIGDAPGDAVIQSKVFHFGTDEYATAAVYSEAMQQYINHYTQMIQERGYEARAWASTDGSQGFKGYVTPQNKEVTYYLWAPYWADVKKTLANGNPMINCSGAWLYIVPGGNAGYGNYLNISNLYNNWSVNNITSTRYSGSGGAVIPISHPQLRGASVVLWNDDGFLLDGISDFDLYDRLKHAFPIIGERTWYGEKTEQERSYAEFEEDSEKLLLTGPTSNPARYVSSVGETIAEYDFEDAQLTTAVADKSENGYDAVLHNAAAGTGRQGQALALDGESYLELPFDTVGFGTSVSFDLYVDEATGKDAVLFGGKDGTIHLNQKNAAGEYTGKLGYERDGYTYTFNYEVPAGRWVNITMTFEASGTKLYVNGQSKGKGTRTEFGAYTKKDLSTSMVLPTEEIGKGVVGRLDNLKLQNIIVNPDSSSQNLARKATKVTTSNNFSDSFTGNSAVDGSLSTRWATENSVTTATMELEFAEPITFNSCRIVEYKATNNYINQYNIEYWDESENDWVVGYTHKVDTTTAVSGVSSGAEFRCSFDSITASKVRLNLTDASRPSIYEFELFAGAENVAATSITVYKNGVEVEENTVLKVYTNEDHEGHAHNHSLTLTALVEPEDATNQGVNWTRTEVTGKVTLARSSNRLTITAVHDPAETNVGPVTLEIAAEGNPEVKKTLTVQVVRMLENNVSISIQQVNDPSAAPKYGQTLEADIHDLKMTDAGKQALTYQWKRTKDNTTENIANATAKTYTLAAEDVGATISVDVTADPNTYYEGTRSATRSQAVVKADGPTIPGSTIYGVKTTTEANNDGKIVGFGTDYANYEYKAKDATTWTAVTAAEVTGLTNGEYQVRIKETATHEAGSPINVTVAAYDTNFKKVNIASNLVNGTITRSVGQADPGTTITLTITPATGYELDAITVTGASGSVTLSGTGNTRTFVLPNEDVTVTATFKKLKFTIDHSGLTNLKCSEDATGSTHSHEVEYGDTAAITLVPDEGYTLPARDTIEIKNAEGTAITGWTINDQGVITITGGVTSNLTIKATGIVKTYVVNYTLTGGLSAPEENAARSVAHKAAYTGTLVAADGYKLPASVTVKMGGADFTDFTYANGVITIAEGKIEGNLVITAEGVKDSGGGSSSGGNSGSSRPATSTEVTTNPDGSKTTTVTDNRTGTVTATTEKPDGTKEVVETKKDGTVTETVTAPDGAKTEKVTDPDKDVTITVTDPEGEEVAKVEIPAAIPETETRFEDVPENHWADEAIHNAAALKLVEGIGDNKYAPVAPMTRGALATVLHRLSNKPAGTKVSFSDVSGNAYYTEGVAWAAKVGVVKGMTEELFAPEQVITREQLATMLARYAKLIGLDTKADAHRLSVFTDGEKTGEWAVDGVAWCVENGILQGKGQNNLDPTANVTRAEVAVMLDRFIALLK